MTSPLYKHEQVINEDTNPDLLFDSNYGRGLDLSPRPHEGYAYGATAEPFPSSMLIPRSEWQARIQEMEERKSRLSDLILQAGLPCHDQDGTNYCWINGPTTCLETMRVVQNQEMVLLSAASVGSKIKNFKNQGGWGKEGLEYIVAHGVCTQADWPENQLKKQYDKPEAWERAKAYQVTEWWELEPRNTDELISCLLQRIPVAVGYNWWSHEVSAIDPVWVDGKIAIRIRNSWGMSWGDNGFGILQGNRMLPDDAVCPRVAVAA